MGINLLRNTRLFATTFVDSTTRKVSLGNSDLAYAAGSGLTVTNAVWNSSGLVTFTTSVAHKLSKAISNRVKIVIADAAGITAYNGTWTIADIPSATTIQAKIPALTTAPAGTYTANSAKLNYYKHHVGTSGGTEEILIGAEGFRFSTTTNVETISPNESGDTPLRGERQFNASVNPVEFSFTTYLRPYKNGNFIWADEGILWNALMGADALNATSLDLAVGAVTAFTVNSSGRVTITVNITTLPTLVVGKVYGIKGIVGTAAQEKEWNAPARLISQDPATKQYVLEYLTAPTVTGSPAGLAGLNIDLNKGAWSIGEKVTYCHAGASDLLRLAPFGLIACMDDITYVFDDCVLDTAQVNFAMDQAASVQWTGKARGVRQYTSETITEASEDDFSTVLAFGGNLYGYAKKANKTAGYITNRLSTVLLKSNIGGYDGTEYYAPITGGSITYSNNIQTITPNNLYEVNQPIAFFLGNRTITGNFSVYLRTGSVAGSTTKQHSAKLLEALMGGSSGIPLVDPKHYLELQVGGTSSATKVHFDMQAVSLQIPEIQSEQILSMNVNFRAQGSKPQYTSNADFSIDNTNELFIRYYA